VLLGGKTFSISRIAKLERNILKKNMKMIENKSSVQSTMLCLHIEAENVTLFHRYKSTTQLLSSKLNEAIFTTTIV
jgi:hypothetical protein